VANSRAIARFIPGAKLLLYTDAGHGFLFQEGTPFAVTVESFPSGAARPLSTAAIRAEFLAGETGVSAAGRTWVGRLKGLSARPSSSGIGGGVSASPTAAKVAEDVLALSALSGPTLSTWEATITSDAAAEQKAAAGLREALGLPAAR
jgi:hypothetical protein